MSPSIFPTILAAEWSGVQWESGFPPWVIALLVVPAAVLISWWCYRRETDVPPAGRLALGALRGLALLLFFAVLCGPYAEKKETRTRRAHLLMLFDVSSSMDTVDNYEPADAELLAKAAGVSVEEVGRRTRLELAREVLRNPENGLLDKFTGDFRFHVFSFGSNLSPLISTGETSEEAENVEEKTPAQRVEERLGELDATSPSTKLGQAISMALDAFGMRDEPVAGVIVVTDGQQTAGSATPLQAGRKAENHGVPVFTIGVGDPRAPKNIQVSNLRAKEVVLAKDTTAFEFTVRASGFEGVPADIELQRLDETGRPAGSPLRVSPAQVVLQGGDEEQHVKVAHQFMRAGTYSLRVGIPVQEEEKIKSDNHVLHTLRVIDRKIKVLYVDATARWEQQYLSNALTRDTDTMLVHTLLLDSDADTPQRTTVSPGWEPLRTTEGLPDREALFEYDVLVIGDVDWRDFSYTRERSLDAALNVKDFVDKGGGLIMISGLAHNPTKYRDTALATVLPVVIDRTAERTDPKNPATDGFALRLTHEGKLSPMMDVANDLQQSQRLWEEHADWRQYWSYPALRAKSGAKVLAVSDHPEHDNKFGPRPLIATMAYGRGRTLYVGVDELWRTRKEIGDLYFYGFYGEAVRYLATYKLLGGNKRFKILTDKDTYALDDSVRLTLDVLDKDYKASKKDTQTVKLDMPGDEPGSRDTVELIVPADPLEAGSYRKTIVPTRPGDYRLYAELDETDKDDQRPEKLFHVVHSSIETRNLLLDEIALREIADASPEGSYRNLHDLPALAPKPRTSQVPTSAKSEKLWDNPWTLMLALALLGGEWMLRKRWQLV